MWSDAIREAAADLARHAGRQGPSMGDLFESAIEACQPSLHLSASTFLRHLPPPERANEPAPENALAAVFDRASALASALDQDPSAEHVVIIASQDPRSGDPAVRGFVRQVTLQALGAYDVELQTSLFHRLLEANEGQGGTRFESLGTVPFRTYSASQMDDPAGPVEAVCGRCGNELSGNLRIRELTADPQRVQVLICGICGAVQGALPPPQAT